MQRNFYEYKLNENVRIEGCGTCKYSIERFIEKDGVNKCQSAQAEDLGDGTVKITSRCSGQSFIYPKNLIISLKEKK